MIIQIAIEPVGYFMAQAIVAGSTDYEALGFEGGLVTEARKAVIVDNMNWAAIVLARSPVAGRC